jgi:hypothetical protein
MNSEKSSITTATFLAEIVGVNFVHPRAVLANAFIRIIIRVNGFNFCIAKRTDSCVFSISTGHKQLLEQSLLKFFGSSHQLTLDRFSSVPLLIHFIGFNVS